MSPYSTRPPVVCCVAPAEPIRWITLPDGTRLKVYPPGQMGGVMNSFREVTNPEKVHWIEVDPDNPHMPLEDLLSLVHAAALSKRAPSTLYAHGPRLRSFRKINGRDYFDVKQFVAEDLPYLDELQGARAATEAERDARRAAGEILRPGPHRSGCTKDHASGPCPKTHRTLASERVAVTRDILRDLGKDPKKKN